MSKPKNEEVACPDQLVAKVFGTIYFAAAKRSEKLDDGSFSIDWTFFKSYCRRIFEEPPIRIENAVHILIKLKMAKFEMGKLPEDPTGPDVILKVHFLDLDAVDNFFEFYHYYYFNPGKVKILEYEDLAMSIIESLVDEANKIAPDRFGMSHVDFKKISDNFKEKTGGVLVPQHIQALETKGAFSKMRNLQDMGVQVEFDNRDFKNLLSSWRILREIKKWNLLGKVDPNEPEVKPAKKVAKSMSCPNCQAQLVAGALFCHSCGQKMPP